MIEILTVENPALVEQTRALFVEYQQKIGFDLCFQNFQQELANLPGDYAPPSGCLLLARDPGRPDYPAGCIALRRIDHDTCEMKRLYVRSDFRGLRVGRRLAEEVIRRAREIGYKKMCLDTVPFMKEAISLYESLGFVDIPPYRHNPIAGARYMELAL